jgi:hypothetical protein
MEQRTIEINGRAYQMMLPSVRPAMQLTNRVAVILGNLIGTLTEDAKNGGLDKFAKALQSVDPDKIDSIFMDAIKAGGVSCGGINLANQFEFEKHFSTYRSDVYQVCCWATWEIVKDFFPELTSFVSKAKGALGSQSPSPKDGQ